MEGVQVAQSFLPQTSEEPLHRALLLFLQEWAHRKSEMDSADTAPVLFSLAGAMISPKFFRKLQYYNTLSELAIYVPLTQIDIPAPVYQ